MGEEVLILDFNELVFDDEDLLNNIRVVDDKILFDVVQLHFTSEEYHYTGKTYELVIDENLFDF